MNFYYENHLGEMIDLSRFPYILQQIDWFDWKYSYDIVNKKTKNYCLKPKEYKSKIAIVGTPSLSYAQRKKEWEDAIDKLLKVIEADVVNEQDGKLYTDNGYYLKCKVIASQKSDWRIRNPIVYADFTILTDRPVWIQEQTKQFLPSETSEDTEGLDFPFDFEFDFAADQTGVAHWEIDHYTSSHFLMRIYGPCENPRILVNGYPYQVFTSLASGDYLEINSRKNTVIKYLANGTTENCYNSRLFYPRIFEKIPSGALTFNWSGAFGFDVVLYIERSEPKWS